LSPRWLSHREIPEIPEGLKPSLEIRRLLSEMVVERQRRGQVKMRRAEGKGLCPGHWGAMQG
jgi:hypothetical protein